MFRYDSGRLRFVNWLLNVNTNGTMKMLCQFVRRCAEKLEERTQMEQRLTGQ
jgi:hypothetical protein